MQRVSALRSPTNYTDLLKVGVQTGYHDYLVAFLFEYRPSGQATRYIHHTEHPNDTR